MKKRTGILIAVTLILTLGIVFLFIIKPILPIQTESCADKEFLFTHSPIDLDSITSISPLGNLGPSAHTFPTRHTYINMKSIGDPSTGNQATPEIPVYSPGDILVTGVSSQEHIDEGFTDYTINFSSCVEVSGYFIHLVSLSGKLKDALDSSISFCTESSHGGERYKSCEGPANVKIVAGEQIGTTGRVGQGNFDFGTQDSRRETPIFANPKRAQNKKDYIVCPYDYYAPGIKEELYAKLGGFSGIKRIIEPTQDRKL
ncbi:MAG TPA: hypothetical protein ENI23_05965 [bacterium]|nr:hypothetical protein [bacterium]